MKQTDNDVLPSKENVNNAVAEATKTKPSSVIICPYCGYEYAPAEIFMPGDLIGHPNKVLRDPLGHIIYVDYDEDDDKPLIKTAYTCDHCNRDFVVNVNISYTTEPQEEELDFSKQEVKLF